MVKQKRDLIIVFRSLLKMRSRLCLGELQLRVMTHILHMQHTYRLSKELLLLLSIIRSSSGSNSTSSIANNDHLYWDV